MGQINHAQNANLKIAFLYGGLLLLLDRLRQNGGQTVVATIKKRISLALEHALCRPLTLNSLKSKEMKLKT